VGWNVWFCEGSAAGFVEGSADVRFEKEESDDPEGIVDGCVVRWNEGEAEETVSVGILDGDIDGTSDRGSIDVVVGEVDGMILCTTVGGSDGVTNGIVVGTIVVGTFVGEKDGGNVAQEVTAIVPVTS